MTRFFTTVLAVTFLGSAMAVSAHAQDSTDSLLESPPQPVNVRIELVITDQRGDDAPIVKRMNVTVGDGLNGSIRSQSHVQDIGEMPLHADAKPRILSDGKILLSLQLQYDFPDDSTTAGRQMLRRQPPGEHRGDSQGR